MRHATPDVMRRIEEGARPDRAVFLRWLQSEVLGVGEVTTYVQSMNAGVHVQHQADELVMAEINAELTLFVTDASKEALERVHAAIMAQDYRTMFTVLAEMCGTDQQDDSLPEVSGQPPPRRGRRITL